MPAPSSGSGFTYRAFLSYSHADKTWADWLHKELETYRVPSHLVGKRTAAGVIPHRLNPIFRDREELASSTDLGDTINGALANSEALIVICSPRSARSHWVNEEVLAFKRLGRANRIFCLIVAGEPTADDTPGRAVEECFSPALRCTFSENAPTSQRTEPVAADVRPGQDGKLNAKLKLVAGILGVGFDQLKQREQHRRMQRMAVVTSVTLAVMAVTIALAVFALVSRHGAVIAQHQAEVAQHAAERRQKRAEGLVDFMLGDLNDKLQQLGRIDVMQAVDGRAMAYFESLPTTDVNSTAQAQRAKALEKIGAVQMGQGQLPGALEAFNASVRLSSRLAAAKPGNVERQIAYSRTLAFIGMCHWNQGNLTAAQQDFEKARRILQPSLETAPGNLTLLQQVAFLDNDLDHVLEARGRAHEALALARERLKLEQRMVTAEPTNADYLAGLGDAHNELGRLALMHGDLATAIAEYRADRAIETRLSEGDPSNNALRGNILRISAILGRTLALAGDTSTGMRDLQQAIDIADELIKSDPQETGYRDLAALYGTQLARLKRLGGDLPGARSLNAQSIATLTILTKTDRSNSYWKGDLANAVAEQAAQSRAAGQPDAARKQVRKALATLEPMLAEQPDERDTLLATVNARLLLADLADDARARSLRENTLTMIQRQKTGKDDPRLLALWIETLLALDRRPDAEPLVTRLWNTGYRDPALVHVLQRAGLEYPVNITVRASLLATDHPLEKP